MSCCQPWVYSHPKESISALFSSAPSAPLLRTLCTSVGAARAAQPGLLTRHRGQGRGRRRGHRGGGARGCAARARRHGCCGEGGGGAQRAGRAAAGRGARGGGQRAGRAGGGAAFAVCTDLHQPCHRLRGREGGGSFCLAAAADTAAAEAAADLDESGPPKQEMRSRSVPSRSWVFGKWRKNIGSFLVRFPSLPQPSSKTFVIVCRRQDRTFPFLLVWAQTIHLLGNRSASRSPKTPTRKSCCHRLGLASSVSTSLKTPTRKSWCYRLGLASSTSS